MAAAGSGHVEPVQYAYEFDQDVKAINDTRNTVVHAAVTFTMANSTQPEICRVIQFLADKAPWIKNARGRPDRNRGHAPHRQSSRAADRPDREERSHTEVRSKR
jgi:hypothetical protein